LVFNKRFAKESTNGPPSPHRLEHPGRALDQPRPLRPRRRPLARGQPRGDRHLPGPRRRSAAAPRADGAQARFVPADQHNEGQAASWALSTELIGEVDAADTVLLGLPLYNFGPPSTVKAWVDHLIAPGLSIDPVSGDGLLGGREMIVLAARGGGYGEGTPREGWDHAQPWLPHGVSLTGLEPRFVTAELTLADVNPAMADLRELAAASLKAAEEEVDALWSASAVA
jgi:FMN-dependent NADH-azoreductase